MPKIGWGVNAPNEFRLVRDADVRPDAAELGSIALVTPVDARKHATRLLDGRDDGANPRRAQAAQSPDADGGVSR